MINNRKWCITIIIKIYNFYIRFFIIYVRLQHSSVKLYLQNVYMPFAIIHKRIVACLDMASGPFVRYLLELHIGRRGHIRYNNIYFPGDDAGWAEVRRAERNATEWNDEDDYTMTLLSTPWSIVNGAAYGRNEDK